MHQRIVNAEGQMQQSMSQGQVQQVMEVQKTNVIVQSTGKLIILFMYYILDRVGYESFWGYWETRIWVSWTLRCEENRAVSTYPDSGFTETSCS